MTLNQFIYLKGLRPADVIVVEKIGFRLLDHYVIYLGVEFGSHVFVANMRSGVKKLSHRELNEMLPFFEVSRIRYFEGTEYERRNAVWRAKSKIGERGYNLLTNNCEHYANDVQRGRKYSHQTQIAVGSFLLAAIFGIGAAISQRDEEDEEYT
ncbi:MAG: lecithin retinol acyltransferase family protein [Bacteroidia bacterium]|nr:lecithin retinol acyltransferase family protein [Bacteroidia bacterium]